MQLISIADFFMGRDKSHAAELTDDMRLAAAKLVPKVNAFLGEAQAAGVELSLDNTTYSHVASGWRPPAINKAAGGAASSKHMSCHAVDIRDNAPGRQLCKFAVSAAGRAALEKLGLYWQRDRKSVV